MFNTLGTCIMCHMPRWINFLTRCEKCHQRIQDAILLCKVTGSPLYEIEGVFGE